MNALHRPTRKASVTLLAISVAGLLALTFFSVAPSVSSVEAASAIAQKAQGCTGSAQPPQLANIYDTVFGSANGLDGWTVKSFSVSSLSYTNSTGLKITGLSFVGSYYQAYHFGIVNGNKTTSSQSSIYKGDATLSIASLSINRNSTTFSASMTGLTVTLHAQDNSTGTWRHTTISGSNSDFEFSWSCTQ